MSDFSSFTNINSVASFASVISSISVPISINAEWFYSLHVISFVSVPLFFNMSVNLSILSVIVFICILLQ